MQHDAADQLDVEVAHVEDAAAGFADDGEGFDQKIVERCALRDAFFEFNGFGGEIDVGELLQGRLEIVDCGDDRTHRLDFALVLVPKILASRASIIRVTPLFYRATGSARCF